MSEILDCKGIRRTCICCGGCTTKSSTEKMYSNFRWCFCKGEKSCKTLNHSLPPRELHLECIWTGLINEFTKYHPYLRTVLALINNCTPDNNYNLQSSLNSIDKITFRSIRQFRIPVIFLIRDKRRSGYNLKAFRR